MKILIALDVNKDQKGGATGTWSNAVNEIQTLADKNPGVVSLGFGAWLLTSDESLPVLEAVVSQATANSYPYRVCVFSDEADTAVWHRDFQMKSRK